MPVSTTEIQQLLGLVIKFTQHDDKFLQHLSTIRDRFRDCFTVVDSLIVNGLKERIRGQMGSVAESTLATSSEWKCVVRRNSEQMKAVRAISLIVANREIL